MSATELTAMVYPTLLDAMTDTHPTSRATSFGVYRFWLDSGYVMGALFSGIVADFVGLGAAIHIVAGLTLLSGLVVAYAMGERNPQPLPVTSWSRIIRLRRPADTKRDARRRELRLSRA